MIKHSACLDITSRAEQEQLEQLFNAGAAVRRRSSCSTPEQLFIAGADSCSTPEQPEPELPELEQPAGARAANSLQYSLVAIFSFNQCKHGM